MDHLLELNENIELSQYINLSKFKFSHIFYSEMLKIISILICNEYFYLKKIIRARHVQTICNIKPKLWSNEFKSWV